MASEEKSFENLLKEAPSAPPPGAVSVVGILSQSQEPEKFVLSLQNGSAVTLEKASVKGFAVLASSVGQTIVRVDLDPAKLPRTDPEPVPWVLPGPAAPFALAAPQQAAAATIAALERFKIGTLWWDVWGVPTGVGLDQTVGTDAVTGLLDNKGVHDTGGYVDAPY
jgi:hypothetical protein